MRQEYILCAAIHFDDGNYYPHHKQYGTGIVACGYRHHLIFTLRPKEFKGKETQGFLTSKGRFVNRIEAYTIAVNAGQIKDYNSNPYSKLFSEDLY
ncbi:MAG: hypothetical protein LBE91_08190 [Tannerella sp.]|nr:hypothetical protein [Tannerella sp.]